MSDAIVNQTTQIGTAVRRLERERKLRLFRFPNGTQMIAIHPKTIAPAFAVDTTIGYAIDMMTGRILLVHSKERIPSSNKALLALAMHDLMLPFFPSLRLDGPEMSVSKDDMTLLVDYLPLMNGVA